MSSLNEIKELVDSIEIFDSHEHVAGSDWGFGSDDEAGRSNPRRKSLPHVLMSDMLRYLLPSTGVCLPNLAPENWDIEDAPAYWKAMQPALQEVRGTAVYTLLKRGLRELYGFDGDEITDDNWQQLNAKIVAVYHEKGASQWLLEVAARAKVVAMVQMAHLPYLLEYWPSLEESRRAREKQLVRPSLVLEPFFWSGFEPDRSLARQRTMELTEAAPQSYDEHVSWMYEAITRHKAAGGAAVKFLCAYQRTLHFEKVSDDEARRLYERDVDNLDEAQLGRLQDNLARHLVRAARDCHLPVMIHTGYATPTKWGDPENLLELVTDAEFADVPFYFAHAGWPREGALALMARTFANVHLGLCWIPGLSPALFTRMFSEMIDLLPANKMQIGMDCGNIEAFYGTTLVTREIIAGVLAAKVDEGFLSRQAATIVARRVLHDNARAMFGHADCG